MDAIDKAISGIHSRLSDDELRPILVEFFEARAVEILAGMSKRDLTLDDMDIKIGGTD